MTEENEEKTMAVVVSLMVLGFIGLVLGLAAMSYNERRACIESVPKDLNWRDGVLACKGIDHGHH